MPELFHRDWVGVFPKDLPDPVDEEGVRPHTSTSKGKIMKTTFWPGSTTPPDGWTLTSDGRLTREATR